MKCLPLHVFRLLGICFFQIHLSRGNSSSHGDIRLSELATEVSRLSVLNTNLEKRVEAQEKIISKLQKTLEMFVSEKTSNEYKDLLFAQFRESTKKRKYIYCKTLIFRETLFSRSRHPE